MTPEIFLNFKKEPYEVNLFQAHGTHHVHENPLTGEPGGNLADNDDPVNPENPYGLENEIDVVCAHQRETENCDVHGGISQRQVGHVTDLYVGLDGNQVEAVDLFNQFVLLEKKLKVPFAAAEVRKHPAVRFILLTCWRAPLCSSGCT